MKPFHIASGLIFALAVATSIQAHGPSLQTDRTVAAPGEEVVFRGEGITVNGEIRVSLQGVLANYPLGTVRGDEHGRFELKVTLPSELVEGEYTVIASGDETATTTLTIEGSHSDTEKSGEPPVPMTGQTGQDVSPRATAEPMEVERSTRGAARAAAWAVTLVSALVGIGLLRR